MLANLPASELPGDLFASKLAPTGSDSRGADFVRDDFAPLGCRREWPMRDRGQSPLLR